MTITVREMRRDDGRSFIEVRNAAVRGIAAKDYPREVIENWAGPPVTEAMLERFYVNPDQEIRLVAEIDGEIVGMGALVVATNELRACYVSPTAIRKGVGSSIVREIERIAMENRVTFLQMNSSLTAEPFYKALGYEVLEYGEHVLRSGHRMACVKMRKHLRLLNCSSVATQEVAATFDERAKDYRKSDWHRRYAERLVELTSLRPGDLVLDSGTGTGFAALAIARIVGGDGRIVAVDVSAGMLQEAQISIQATGLQNIELLEADATDLKQYSPSTFDAVICAAALLYMPIPRALAEWRRLLKPGGIVAFSTMRTGSPQAGQLFRDCAERFGIALKDPSQELGSVDRCRLALEVCGFTNLEVIQEQVEVSTLDLAQAWESNFRSAKHYAVRQLSPSDQEAFRQQYESALKQAQMRDPLSISRADVLYAFGRK